MILVSLKCTHLNVGNCYSCQLLYLKNVYDCNFDVACIAEPYLVDDAIPIKSSYTSYINKRTALIIKRDIIHKLLFNLDNLIVINVGVIILITSYISPNKPKDTLYNSIDIAIKSYPHLLPVVVGDLNTRLPLLESRVGYSKDAMLLTDRSYKVSLILLSVRNPN